MKGDVFEPNALVFAKIRGYPAWPAKVMNFSQGCGRNFLCFSLPRKLRFKYYPFILWILLVVCRRKYLIKVGYSIGCTFTTIGIGVIAWAFYNCCLHCCDFYSASDKVRSRAVIVWLRFSTGHGSTGWFQEAQEVFSILLWNIRSVSTIFLVIFCGMSHGIWNRKTYMLLTTNVNLLTFTLHDSYDESSLMNICSSNDMLSLQRYRQSGRSVRVQWEDQREVR